MAGLLWLPGSAPLAGLFLPHFPALTQCAWWALPRQTRQRRVWWKCTWRQSWDSLIPTAHTEWDWNYLYSRAWTCLYHSPISSQRLTSDKMPCFIQEVMEKKAHFSYLLFFALLSCTVLKTKLILDLTNLPFNMTMQSISFYLDFAFYILFFLLYKVQASFLLL